MTVGAVRGETPLELISSVTISLNCAPKIKEKGKNTDENNIKCV